MYFDRNESEKLKNKFSSQTYTGSILIALNPYTAVPIYGADEIRMYR